MGAMAPSDMGAMMAAGNMGMASMGNMGAAGGMGGKWTSYNVQFLT
jgi:hypothetical protein